MEAHPDRQPAAKTVFISYPHKDGTEAAEFLQLRLKGAGLGAYQDDHSLRPGSEFPKELLDNIAACDCFVVLVNSAALTSDWVNREIAAAHSSGRRIVPLLLEAVELPPTLRDLHALKMLDRAKWWEPLHKLVSDLEDGGRKIPRVINLSNQIEFKTCEVEGVLLLNESQSRNVDLTDPKAIAPAARALVEFAMPFWEKAKAGIVPPSHPALAWATLAALMGHNLLPRMYWPFDIGGGNFRISSQHAISLQDLRNQVRQDLDKQTPR